MGEIIKAYKGFNKDMTCRGKQYEEGKEYIEDRADACHFGMHACELPLDCFGYYEPSKSVFHEVEQSGDISKGGDDTKIASTKMKIGARLDIAGIVKASIEYITERAKPSNRHHTKGSRSANSATGDGSANSATGYGSANSATGSRSANSATGYGSANSATGYGSANITTGTESENSGNGERNISIGWGKDNRCRGIIGSFIVLSEWGDWDGEKYIFKGAVMVEVDGKKVKADTWYMLKDGKICEVE